MSSVTRWLPVLALLLCAQPSSAQTTPTRPFGTLREQAAMQQEWLQKRLDTFLPGLMRKHGIDLWVVPMREYNEDPIFTAIVSPQTFAARRRTIYVFFDTCAAAGTPPSPACVERIALGGTSQGGLYEARRTTIAVAGDVGGRQAELWGDQQWSVLKQVLEERKPKRIAINSSRIFAFADGLSSGELEGMRTMLGPQWTKRFVQRDGLAVDLIATRQPDEAAFYAELNRLTWQIVREMFSAQQIVPGQTRTSDLVWFFRQRVNDLGLGTWFQPTVDVQRQGADAASLGEDPIILEGDVLHCDVGITALGLATDTQHNGYVLLPGETEPPAGLTRALRNANRLQDITMEELRAGRTGNEVLRASLARMRAEGIDGTLYSHPIGKHGHGAGPLVGLWDYQDGVPGRGDATVIPNMWYSIELQATTPVPEWGGQPVRMAQEEDAIIGPDGRIRWALRRQSNLFLVQ